MTRSLGVEVELLAPRGRSRESLAEALAGRLGGTVHRVFHPESEPSRVPGQPVFHNLTLGFEVRGTDGALLARCLDDLTLQDDLVKTAPPRPGWYRVLSDDRRILQLVDRHCDATAPLQQVLEPLAALFGTPVDPGPGGLFRVVDLEGHSVAMAAPLPGERERPCELVTAPLGEDRAERLELLLAHARELGFTAPQEGATHLHVDGRDLRDAALLAALGGLWGERREAWRERFRTNPRCRRLGPWSPELRSLLADPELRALPWTEARTRLLAVKPTKYCDLNLVNLLVEPRGKLTLELRILPVYLEAGPILEAAEALEALLDEARELSQAP